MPASVYSKSLIRILKKLLIFSLSLILGLVFLFSIQYYKIEIFIKEKNTPFSGDHFYNPYKDFSQNTLRANFHAHSNAWFHMTDGTHKPDEIYEHYKNNGYDIISISDYQKITTDKYSQNYIPVYEHGYNYRKSHQLVINNREVNYSDFSIFLNYHTRQQVINMLRSPDGLVALAHPNLRHGYRVEDMKYLKGYDFIEVFNRYNTASKLWDAALTSGYPAWIFANDDCHDINRPDLTFNNWIRISSSGQTREEILSALKSGCFYGVRNLNHVETNFLDSCIIR